MCCGAEWFSILVWFHSWLGVIKWWNNYFFGSWVFQKANPKFSYKYYFWNLGTFLNWANVQLLNIKLFSFNPIQSDFSNISSYAFSWSLVFLCISIYNWLKYKSLRSCLVHWNGQWEWIDIFCNHFLKQFHILWNKKIGNHIWQSKNRK